MPPIVSINNVSKVYDTGHQALKSVSLDIEEGEILALLGPNGAGKTTLISAVCGISKPTNGTITVGGYDISTNYRDARALIGLVPQDVFIEQFETVANTLRFSRGLFGKSRNEAVIDEVLKTLSLYEKRDEKLMTLSGGMKRRVLIGKALAHEPRILFLDEPTAGVDVELRKDMWKTVENLKKQGVTIILTTHYIEEAEAIADRIGVINQGEILLVEDKKALMQRLGQKMLCVHLESPLEAIPDSLSHHNLTLGNSKKTLEYTYTTKGERTGITTLLADIQSAGLKTKDIETYQSSLEDIFVNIVSHQGTEK